MIENADPFTLPDLNKIQGGLEEIDIGFSHSRTPVSLHGFSMGAALKIMRLNQCQIDDTLLECISRNLINLTTLSIRADSVTTTKKTKGKEDYPIITLSSNSLSDIFISLSSSRIVKLRLHCPQLQKLCLDMVVHRSLFQSNKNNNGNLEELTMYLHSESYAVPSSSIPNLKRLTLFNGCKSVKLANAYALEDLTLSNFDQLSLELPAPHHHALQSIKLSNCALSNNLILRSPTLKSIVIKNCRWQKGTSMQMGPLPNLKNTTLKETDVKIKYVI